MESGRWWQREEDSYPFEISMSTSPKNALPNSHLSSLIILHGKTRNVCFASKEMIPAGRKHGFSSLLPTGLGSLSGSHSCCFTQDTPLTNPGWSPLRPPHLPGSFHLCGLPGSLLESHADLPQLLFNLE